MPNIFTNFFHYYTLTQLSSDIIESSFKFTGEDRALFFCTKYPDISFPLGKHLQICGVSRWQQYGLKIKIEVTNFVIFDSCCRIIRNRKRCSRSSNILDLRGSLQVVDIVQPSYPLKNRYGASFLFQ